MLKALLSDRGVVSGLLTRVVQGIAGPISAVLVLRFFDPEVQGYYYTFFSLLGLQIFLELGLSTVVTTFASHEWASLSSDQNGKVVGDTLALARLATLAKKAFRWYAIGAGLLLLVLIVFGIWFFDSRAQSGVVEWRYPWIALCCLASSSFIFLPAWALLQGCGQIATINSFRLVETICRSAVLWTAIAMGATLWSGVVALAVSVLISGGFLVLRYRTFFASLLKTRQTSDFDWKSEVAPVQWRIAASWIAGYFAFYLFTPATFFFLGSKEAGQVGITWALVSGLSGIAGTWLQVRSPAFGGLVAQKEFTALDTLATHTALVSGLVCAVLSGGVLAGLLILDAFRPDISSRFLPIGAIAIFLLAELLHQISMVQSTYLRAFKREPFLGVSLGSAIIIGVGTLVLTPITGGFGPSLSYLMGISAALVWGTFVFLRSRREWTFPRSQ